MICRVCGRTPDKAIADSAVLRAMTGRGIPFPAARWTSVLTEIGYIGDVVCGFCELWFSNVRHRPPAPAARPAPA